MKLTFNYTASELMMDQERANANNFIIRGIINAHRGSRTIGELPDGNVILSVKLPLDARDLI